jgi:hypothetical protein
VRCCSETLPPDKRSKHKDRITDITGGSIQESVVEWRYKQAINGRMGHLPRGWGMTGVGIVIGNKHRGNH